MELTRVVLLAVLFLMGIMLWNAWENEEAPKLQNVRVLPPAKSTFQPVSTISGNPIPPPTVNTAAPAVSTAPAATPAQRLVTVHTDVLDVKIDTLGGNIVQADLLKYPQDLKNPQPVELLSQDPATLYVAQSGLISNDGPDTVQGQANYHTDKNSYALEPGQDQLVVNLKWKNSAGVIVNKQFTFKRDDYAINVNYVIDNRSSKPWAGQFYTQLERKKVEQSHSFFGVNPYMGGAISSPDKPYQKISFDKMSEQNLNMSIIGGWAAMLQHYFLSAWVPDPKQTFNYYSHVSDGNIYTLGMLGPPLVANPNTQITTGSKLYVGPEILDRLQQISPSLNLTVDYGVLWFISSAIFWLMKKIYDFVGNWGWSIVLVTVLIKLAFYHLSAKSYRSMAAMRRLQPRLQALKERFGDDRQKITQATMELYKAEKVNPLGGCLPIVVQIPVFIALYWVLLESVELRQAPFILWIQDLSVKDPYYILPIIMGITMWVQQKLNPPPPDPMQAKMMQFLPIFFTFLFISFPAGLVLYWVVNNSLSILQQWYIMRSVDLAADAKKKNR